MKLIIDIDKELKSAVYNCGLFLNPTEKMSLINAINNGIPLPKGHGKLMILSENKLKENQIDLDFSCQKWISEVGLSNATVAIIETDKAESEV